MGNLQSGSRRPTEAEQQAALAGDESTVRDLLRRYSTCQRLTDFSRDASFQAAQFALLALFEHLTLCRPYSACIERWCREIAWGFDREAALEMTNLLAADCTGHG